MEKLRTGKWATDMASAAEVTAFREEAREMIAKYGWEDRKVTPFSWAEPVLDVVNYGVIEGKDDYDELDRYNKAYVLSMLNGLVPILNAWERNHLELEANGVEMRLKNGKITKVLPEFIEFYLESGIAELIQEGE